MITPEWTYDNIQCFVTKARCCHGHKVNELSDTLKKKGMNNCIRTDIRKLLMLNYGIGVLSRYAPEGDVIIPETLSSFTFNINNVVNGVRLHLVVNGVEIVNQQVGIGQTKNQFATSVTAGINSNTNTTGITAVDPDTADSNITIYAPIGTGASFNGAVFTYTSTASQITLSSFTSPMRFLGGITQVIATKPCLADEKAKNIYENIDSLCGCDTCGTGQYFTDLNGSSGGN